MSIEPQPCTICGTDTPTIADTPLCGHQCRDEWIQSRFNQMEDNEAECPICGSQHHSVKDAIYHANKKHDGDWNRTKKCKQCHKSFVPKNWSNPNLFCSEECFSAAGIDGRPHLGQITYTCSRDDCSIERTVDQSFYNLMSDNPTCSRSCAIRGDAHPNWKGGSEKIRKQWKYNYWKQLVLQNSDECEDCGSDEALSAHHTIPISVEPAKAFMPSNGKVLCADCHSSRHPDMARELFT